MVSVQTSAVCSLASLYILRTSHTNIWKTILRIVVLEVSSYKTLLVFNIEVSVLRSIHSTHSLLCSHVFSCAPVLSPISLVVTYTCFTIVLVKNNYQKVVTRKNYKVCNVHFQCCVKALFMYLSEDYVIIKEKERRQWD